MKTYNLNDLLQKHVCAMTGEEFIFLMGNLSGFVRQVYQPLSTDDEKPRHLVYGIKKILDTFGSRHPTSASLAYQT